MTRASNQVLTGALLPMEMIGGALFVTDNALHLGIPPANAIRADPAAGLVAAPVSEQPAVPLAPPAETNAATIDSLNCKSAPLDIPSVYQAIAGHQLASTGWRYAEVIKELHRWQLILAAEFHLGLPEVAFCIGYTRKRCHGYYRPGHNWYGFQREILLKDQHVLESLEQGDFSPVLVTEAHELLHAWQDKHGTPGRNNYHNAEFRAKAITCGLIVDSRGFTDLDAEGPLAQLFDKHGIAKIGMPEGVMFRPAGSKLHKWVCGCQPQYGVRVAIEDFDAGCFRCGERFVRCDCEQVGGNPSSPPQ